MVLFGIGLVVAASVSLATVKPLSDYYAGTRNLDRFYLDFRHAVTSACPPQAPVFLAMDNSHDKFKHLAALYLPDRDVLSDWTGDEFVRHYLSADRVSATLVPGSCVVEAVNASKWLGPDAITTGPFRVGSFHPRPGIAIVSQSGGYSREGDNRNWWHWVEKSIDFKLMTVDIAATASATRLHFDYLPLGRQGLRVQVRARNGATQSVELPPGSASPFDATVALPAASVVGVLVETDGQAATLSATDTRKAAFKISNLSVEPVSP
jgi:hypothetical protein